MPETTLQKLRKNNIIAFDTETTGTHPFHGDQPFGFSFCDERMRTVYVEFEVDPYTREVQSDDHQLSLMRSLLEDPTLDKVMHHKSFDVRMMQQAYKIHTYGDIHDTMFMAHACQSQELNYQLKYLSQRYGDISKDDESELQQATISARRIGKKLNWKLGQAIEYKADGTVKKKANIYGDYWMPGMLWRMTRSQSSCIKVKLKPKELRSLRAKVPDTWKDVCRRYAVKDAIRTMTLYQFYLQAFKVLEGATRAYGMEQSLWPIVYEMEERGVRVDLPTVKREIEGLTATLMRELKALRRLAGPRFNPNSPKQVKKWIEDDLKLDLLPDKKDNSKTTTNRTSLERLKNHPAVSHLILYRFADKGLTNFLLPYQRKVLPDPLTRGKTKVLHPSFFQVGPKTRRFSCRDPNLQNVANATAPTGTECIQARTPFGPRPDYVWLHADYDQLEVRIFADRAQEEFMLDAIRHERDLHTEFTNRVWGWKMCERAIKGVQVSIGFGSSHQLSETQRKAWQQLGIKPDTRLSLAEQRDVCIEWLKRYDWNIVKAEAALGKKSARTCAKMIFFGIIFGGGANALMGLMECDRREASELMAEYHTAFPRIKIYMTEISTRGREDGYILNAYGCRISIDAEFAYRACNYSVQGSAASQLKRAMIRCHDWLRAHKVDGHLVMTIHDELVFEIRERECTPYVMRNLKRIMEDHEGAYCIPTTVKMDMVTESWSSKRRIEDSELQ